MKDIGILYFDNNKAYAENIISMLKDVNCEICYYKEFPKNGIEEFKKRFPNQPDLVLIDTNTSADNGFDICQNLRKEYLANYIPIIFLSDLITTDNILEAYKCGGDEFISKDIGPKELLVKLRHGLDLGHRVKSIDKELKISNRIAVQAISNAGKLGEIIKFIENCFYYQDYDSLATGLMQTINRYDLRNSIKLYTAEVALFYTDDEEERKRESDIISLARNQGKIFDFNGITIFNYPSLSLLVRNMPTKDITLYEKLKDNISILLNAVESRIISIHDMNIATKHHQRIISTADILSQMILEIDDYNTRLSEQFANVIQDLEINVSADLMKFSLLEAEEKVLTDHIYTSINEATKIFEKCIVQGKHYKDIMTSLLKTLD